MKSRLSHLCSPFLDEGLLGDEVSTGWQARPQTPLQPETRDADEFVHECDERYLHDGEIDRDDEAGAQYFDSEAWSGGVEQLDFRDRVLAAHLEQTARRRGTPQRDLDSSQRDLVPGTTIEMRSDAAAAAGRLLGAANAELAAAQLAGHADARLTQRVTTNSGYRNRDHQMRLWLGYFPRYYRRTHQARERLVSGPHSDEAVAYMLRRRGDGGFGLGGRIAAPGYSNHQNGIAIDWKQVRHRGHEVRNDSGDEARAHWRASWFHGWLVEHASRFGFAPIATEEWHWEFRPGRATAAPAQSETAPVLDQGLTAAQPPLGRELRTFTESVGGEDPVEPRWVASNAIDGEAWEGYDRSSSEDLQAAADDLVDDEAEDFAVHLSPGLDGELASESEIDADDEHEFDDETDAEQALEEEDNSQRTPLAVPVDNPVPFAPQPPEGSFWPVRTDRPQGRLVSFMYQAPSGIVGRAGRMFLAARRGNRHGRVVSRWHVGVDLFCRRNDLVVACEAGRIVAFRHFYTAKSGQNTCKLLVEHDGSGIVINYGEVRPDSLKHYGLKVGSPVQAGQPIGLVSDADMLHFETYLRGTTDSARWWKADKQPPHNLLNPTRYLLALARTGQTRSANTGPASPTATTPAAGRLPTLPGLSEGVSPPSDPAAYRTFRLTTYHVVDQADEPTGTVRVPVLDDQGRTIGEGSPAFFAKLALEGTARLTDGRLINVTGKTVAVSHDTYAPVLEYHRKAYARGDQDRAARGKPPAPTLYSGIATQNGRVVRAMSFHELPASRRGVGYGSERGVPYTPFRTLAADIGTPKYSRVEPRWKGKGGLVPPGTRVYIKEYDGLRLPDGTVHDGWFVVNDTGGAIFGAHFDVFTGTAALRRGLVLPAFGQVWFDGIEQRIPGGYRYGLQK